MADGSLICMQDRVDSYRVSVQEEVISQWRPFYQDAMTLPCRDCKPKCNQERSIDLTISYSYSMKMNTAQRANTTKVGLSASEGAD